VYLPGGNIHMPLALASELYPSSMPKSYLAWYKTMLAGDILLEIGLNRVQAASVGSELLPRIQGRLSDLLIEGALTPRERASAGDTLARLGDPRFDENAWHLPAEPLRGFIHIPAGKFIMGTSKEDVGKLAKKYRVPENYFENEIPKHTMELPDYYLARYPVTVAQFKAFVEDKKYKPANSESLEGLASQPVRYITWFDAMAYCEWLDDKMKTLARSFRGGDPREIAFWRRLAEGKLKLSLPSEAEWEKAARGTDGREFPWKGEFDANNANVEMNVGRASVVGCFPKGESPYGLQDMSGNVWEWTRSIYKEYPYNPVDGREDMNNKKSARVLRGGAFSRDDRGARCAARNGDDPGSGWRYSGFRVVVAASSPISLSYSGS
jgi:formylglycine-generating enzyme required for sulfatase activity